MPTNQVIHYEDYCGIACSDPRDVDDDGLEFTPCIDLVTCRRCLEEIVKTCQRKLETMK